LKLAVKKTYLIPVTEISQGVAEQMIAASITNISGDSDLPIGTDEVPSEADVKESGNSFWDGEW
jgi:hypothetical protein